MAAGKGNAAGYQPFLDMNGPGIMTGRASVNLSGGMLVFASGTSNALGSVAATIANGDIAFAVASGGQFTGVVCHDAASGTVVAVATRGAVLLLADGTVTCGTPVSCAGANAVADSGSVAANLAHQRTVGRALSTAGSEGYALIDIGRA